MRQKHCFHCEDLSRLRGATLTSCHYYWEEMVLTFDNGCTLTVEGDGGNTFHVRIEDDDNEGLDE